MTLLEMIEASRLQPPEVRASRRRYVVRAMARVTRTQRDRELLELGYLELGGDGGGA